MIRMLTSWTDFYKRLQIFMIVAAFMLPFTSSAFALTEKDAEGLVTKALNEIINLAEDDVQTEPSFKRFFSRYGDSELIARQVLGPVSRTASKKQITAFSKVFHDYLIAKYKNILSFLAGSKFSLTKSYVKPSYIEVEAKIFPPDGSVTNVSFLITKRNGKYRFFNIIVDGISLVLNERSEMGLLLDARGGNLDQLIKHLSDLSDLSD